MGTLCRSWSRAVLTALLLVAAFSISQVQPTAAEPESWMPTIVTPEGALWALPPGESPRLVNADIGRGLTVTDLAWNPTRPELLLVRREMRGSEPYDSLYRVDLRSGTEELLEENIGPQARLLDPRWSPDGTWGFARLECCLSRQLVRFSFPTRAGSPNRISTNELLPAEAREVTMAEAGGFNPAGEILMNVICCLGDEISPDPSGIYSVSRNFQQTRLLVAGDHGSPIGSATDGSWLATLRESAANEGYQLSVVKPDGSELPLKLPSDEVLADRGSVLADGTIVVATWPAGTFSLIPRYSAVWTLQMDGSSPRNVTAGYSKPFVAFGLASTSILNDLSAAGPAPELRTKVYFSQEPESFNNFTAVFPAERGALTPRSAIQALIDGPTPDEVNQGFSPELRSMFLPVSSTCGTDFELFQDGGTTVLRFCREIASAGIGQDARFMAQVNATLRQFPGVSTIRVLDSGGHCLFDMSGEDRCLPASAR